MVIGIRVEAENFETGESRHTNSSYFTMVAMTEERKSRKVPGLILETKAQARRFLEAMNRRNTQFKTTKELERYKSKIEIDLNLLENQNCMIINF